MFTTRTEQEINPLDGIILERLGQCPGGATLDQLRRMTQSESTTLQGRLLHLQSMGKVELRSTSWRLTGPLRVQMDAKPLDDTGARRARPFRPDAPGLSSSRWSDFRRLCQYYAECVRLEEGTRVSTYAEHEGNHFVRIPGTLDWRALAMGNPIALHVQSDWSAFLVALRTAARGGGAYLGGPVDVFIHRDRQTREEYHFVTPVFLVPVEPSVEGDYLMLKPVGHATINHGWIERRFRNADERRAFMEICGLETPGPSDDETEAAAHPDEIIVPLFPDLVKSVKQFYPKWWAARGEAAADIARPFTELRQPGVYDRTVLIAQPKMRYTARLFRELRRLANAVPDEELDGSALSLLFPHDPPPPPPKVEQEAAQETPALPAVTEFEGLNLQQREACRLAMGSRLLVVTGPPGTGKSRVVTHVMANAAVNGQSALFASRNHQAIEAVVPRLNAISDPSRLVVRLSQPFGQTHEDALACAFNDLFARPKPRDATQRLRRALTELAKLARDSDHLLQAMDRTFQQYERLDEAEVHLASLLWDKPVIETDVLRAPAVPTEKDVRAHVAAAEEMLRRAGQWWFRLLELLTGGRKQKALLQDLRSALAVFAAEVPGHIRPSNALPSSIKAAAEELELWLPVATAVDEVRKLHRIRAELAALHSLPMLHERHQQLLPQLRDRTGRVLRQYAEAAGSEIRGEDRQRLATVWAGMQNHGQIGGGGRSRAFERALRSAMPLMLKHIPLWATTNLSAGRDLPFAAGVFDLLIIDEASQCDIASVVPLLFRAKRAMIVGDPMQLSHVAAMSRDVDWRLRQQNELTDAVFERYTYRVNSFFQLATSSALLEHRVQLQDHHRCHPAIAQYCNEAFYNETLTVLTPVDRLNSPRGVAGIRWTQVTEDASEATTGPISVRQITAIVDELRRLKDDGFSGTVGVVTPFRLQANRIRDRVASEMAGDIPLAWRFHVDTADGFQGDERDVIMLSLVGHSALRRGSLWFLKNSPNRFNVAVSRARALLHVFGDREWGRNCGISHIEQLCQAAEQVPVAAQLRSDLIGPVWEPRLAAAMQAAGLSFQQQYPACGKYLDFALFKGNLKLDVEVDGEAYHRDANGARKTDDLWRDLTLVADGWKVLRFWVYELKEDMDGCVRKIVAALDKRTT